MRPLTTTGRYSGGAIAFHWTIALLVAFNVTIGFLHDPIKALAAWMPAHKAIGITILALTLGRLAWRLAHHPPPLPATVAPWERGIAHAAHWTFYGLLVLMPLTGWLMVSGTDKRRPLDWFGVFDIPYLPVSNAAGEFGSNGHGILAWVMLALIVLHIAAALRHYLILRDSVLARMAPALAKR